MPFEAKRFVQRIRVPLGFAFALVFIVFAQPTVWTLAAGGIVAAIGLAIRAWASGHIRKASVLALTGPYAFTRNPLYLGSLILGVGFTIAAGVWWLAFIFAALFLGIYWPVMRVEADDMLRIFGDEFEDYRRHVPVFFPRITPWRKGVAEFDLRLYFQYREYRALIGAVVAMLFLAAKGVFLK